jgi:hypothetical protein
MKEYLRVYVMDGIEYYKKDGVLYPLAQVPHPVRMQHQELKELATLVAEAQDQCRNIVDVAARMVVAHLRSLLPHDPADIEVGTMLQQSCELISLDGEVRVNWVAERGLRADGNKMSAVKVQVSMMLDDLKHGGLVDNTALKLLGKLLRTKAGAVVSSDSLRLVRDLELPHDAWLAIRQQLINAFDETPPVGSLRVYLADGEGGWVLQKVSITGNDISELAGVVSMEDYPA